MDSGETSRDSPQTLLLTSSRLDCVAQPRAAAGRLGDSVHLVALVLLYSGFYHVTKCQQERRRKWGEAPRAASSALVTCSTTEEGQGGRGAGDGLEGAEAWG